MGDQNADLNQSSGIFGEERKSFWKKVGEGVGNLFLSIKKALAKIFIQKSIDEKSQSDLEGVVQNTSQNSGRDNKNTIETNESSFVGPMNHNIFTDEKEAKNLVRHEAVMSDVVPEMNGSNTNGRGDSGDFSNDRTEKNLPHSREINRERDSVQEHNFSQITGREAEALPEIFYPETVEDLVWLIKRLPETVLTKQQKQTLAAAMSFDSKLVKEAMTPKSEVIIIHENDFMGPLTLSRLYQSGLSHFPVVGLHGEIVGIIHTKTLFSLSVKETDRASAFLDKNVYYMSEDYTLKDALMAFIRTSCYFFIVVDGHGKVTGLLSFKKLISLIVGDLPESDFDQDQDLMSVVKHARELRENNIER